MSKTYSEKLRDPRWQKKRLEIMQRDGFRCVVCKNDKDTLNVHHSKGYRNGLDPWEYPPVELVTLCEPCHERKHFAPPGMKFYLAGKISKVDWRAEILGEHRPGALNDWSCDDNVDYSSAFMNNAIAGRHHYCGPFFISCDHGCAHTRPDKENPNCGHGVSLVNCTVDNQNSGRESASRNCRANLESADAVFAWISSFHAYGTFVEIGYAAALGKPIGIGFDIEGSFDELWFLKSMAWFVDYSASAKVSFDKFLVSLEAVPVIHA